MIELAEESPSAAVSGSTNAAFTMRWQSSKVPSTAKVRTPGRRTINCRSCVGLTCPFGYRSTTRTSSIPANPSATALPVSPDVATRIVSRSSESSRKCPMSRAIVRAPKSLNESVGP